MKINLNGWQRLWVVVSVLMLILAVITVGMRWPERNGRIVEELKSSSCERVRNNPEYWFKEDLNIVDPFKEGDASYTMDCYDLQWFLYLHKVKIKSIVDYDKYLLREKMIIVIIGFTVWVSAVLLLYASGWTIGWIARGFPRKPRANG